MVEERVLEVLAGGLRDAFAGSAQTVEVYVGQPSRPLTAKDTGKLRVVLEDAGTDSDAGGVDGGWVYRARVEVGVEIYSDPQAARGARRTVSRYFLGLFLRESGLSSGRWEAEGWSVRDHGRRYFALGDFSARIYSDSRLRERMGV